MERGFDFKEEDKQIVHPDDVGKDGVDHTKIGKRVPWLDGKMMFGEAHMVEDPAEHPIVLVVDGGVVWDASESVKYVLGQHGLTSDCLTVSTKHGVSRSYGCMVST